MKWMKLKTAVVQVWAERCDSPLRGAEGERGGHAPTSGASLWIAWLDIFYVLK